MSLSSVMSAMLTAIGGKPTAANWNAVFATLRDLSMEDLQVLDSTVNNANTLKHGLLMRLDGNPEHFLRADGVWAVAQAEKGDTGLSAYQVWLAAGHTGTEADYLASLVSTVPGPTGSNGLSAYQVWLAAGHSGTEADYLASLVSTVPGPTGATGATGADGGACVNLGSGSDGSAVFSARVGDNNQFRRIKAGTNVTVTQETNDVLIASSMPAHGHSESEITGLTTDLAGKAAAAHSHAESDITGLAADLAARMFMRTYAAGTGTTLGTMSAFSQINYFFYLTIPQFVTYGSTLTLSVTIRGDGSNYLTLWGSFGTMVHNTDSDINYDIKMLLQTNSATNITMTTSIVVRGPVLALMITGSGACGSLVLSGTETTLNIPTSSVGVRGDAFV